MPIHKNVNKLTRTLDRLYLIVEFHSTELLVITLKFVNFPCGTMNVCMHPSRYTRFSSRLVTH